MSERLDPAPFEALFNRPLLCEGCKRPGPEGGVCEDGPNVIVPRRLLAALGAVAEAAGGVRRAPDDFGVAASLDRALARLAKAKEAGR